MWGFDWNKKPKKASVMPELHPKQPTTLYDAVADALRKGENASIRFLHVDPKSSLEYNLQGVLPIVSAREIVEGVEGIEGYIRAQYGGGRFWAIVMIDKIERARYSFNIGGVPEYKDRSGSGSGDNNGEKKERAALSNSALVERLLDNQQAMVNKMMEGKGNNGLSTFEQQMISTSFDNNVTRQNNQMDDFRNMLSLMKEMQPTIPPEDPSSAILGQLIPLATAFIAAKAGGNGAPAGASTGIPPQLASLLANATPEQIQQFTKQLPAPQGVQGTALPQPGASQPTQPQPQAEAKATEEPVVAAGRGSASPSPADPHSSIAGNMVRQFETDVARNADPGVLANMLINIIGYCRSLESPPPVLAGLLKANEIGELSDEYDKFCAAVPGLAESAEKQQQLKISLMMLLGQDATEEADGADAITQDLEPDIGTNKIGEINEGSENAESSRIRDGGGNDPAESAQQSEEVGVNADRETANASQAATG